MAKTRRSRREVILGAAGLLAAGGILAVTLDRITDPVITARAPVPPAPPAPVAATPRSPRHAEPPAPASGRPYR